MMKLNKVTKTAIAFTVGASVFVTTAFADMMLGSGYDKFKQAIKTTAHFADEKFDSYTLITTMDINYDDELLQNYYSSIKVDNVNKQRYAQDITTNFVDDTKSNKNERYDDPVYHLFNYNNEGFNGYRNTIPNPNFEAGDNFSEAFTNEYSDEIEKVIDAAVGNMKSLVQYDKNGDGRYQFNGELTSSQVPALYNAMLSLILKDSLEHDLGKDYINQKTKDVYVSHVAGAAIAHEDGYLEKIEGQIELTFTNEDNKQHILLFSLKAEFVDINNTTVIKPEFDESTISEVYENEKYLGLSAKYIGVYKNNIVLETETEIKKLGERILTISDVSNGQFSGTYEEIITATEDAEYYVPIKLEFESVTDKNIHNLLQYKNVVTGEIGYGTINENYDGTVYFDIGMSIDEYGDIYYGDDVNAHNPTYNSTFFRVFE